MLKRILVVTILMAFASLTAVASDREDDVNRTQKAAQVFKEIMNTPDQGIPYEPSGIGEVYRHHSRGQKVCLRIRWQLWQGNGNLSHRAWLERSHVCGD